MCNPTESESGQLLTIQPCGWYIKLLSEKSQLEGRCAGMEDGIIINKATIANQSELIEKLLAENEALKQERDNMEALKDEVIRERDVAERALELIRQEAAEWNTLPRAPHWTEYDGTEATLPPSDEYVLVSAKAGWRDYDKCRDRGEMMEWRCQGLPLEIGDRWMPWPEGVE